MAKRREAPGHIGRNPQADDDGMLVVNVPFCGRFQEYAMLGNFLAEHCLPQLGLRGARILGCDSLDCYYYEWAVAKRWFAEFHPQIEVQLQVRDLQHDPLPQAGLTIALHPEVTWGGPWFPIMGSVFRAAQSGVCLIASFFEDEVKTLKNMVDIYGDPTVECEEVSNPFYASTEGDLTSKRMRFLMLLHPPKIQNGVTRFRWLGSLLNAMCQGK